MDFGQASARRRRSRSLGVLVAGLVAAVIAGCGGSSSTNSAATSNSTATSPSAPVARTASVPAPVAARILVRRTALGRILVDARGRTLYLFSADRGGHSACAAACARFWPLETTGAAPVAGAGVRASLLGAVKDAGGTSIVTYHGHPLHRFALDARSGQTRGEERRAFGGRWDVVSPAGAPIRPQPAAQPAAIQTSATTTQPVTTQTPAPTSTQTAAVTPTQTAVTPVTSTTHTSSATHTSIATHTSTPPPPASPGGIPQSNGGDQDADNNGGPSDGDGNV